MRKRPNKRQRAVLKAKYARIARAGEPAKFVTNWQCMHPHGSKRSPSERFTGMNANLKPSNPRYIPV